MSGRKEPAGRNGQAGQSEQNRPTEPAGRKGRVILAGAGCGPGLITVMGLQAVRAAEVLVYDDLIDPALPEEAPRDCERIYVGKRSGAHSLPQEEISMLLCEKAAEGKLVVRLKGGDSFVFGRGGEECLALHYAGIPFQVIPGVTSAAAVPEHFGIPVTHRGTAQSFTVVTGHSGTGEEENYEALAALKGTLVFLMGIRRLKEITGKLMACGKNPETPAAVLTEGFSPAEHRIDGTLETIASLAEGAPTPGILVVGPAAGFHLSCPQYGSRVSGMELSNNKLSNMEFPGMEFPDMELPGMELPGFESPGFELPGGKLSGCRVTVAGSIGFAERTARLLRERGAAAETAVCLKIEPLPENIPEGFDAYSWIVFTSANGIDLFFRFLKEGSGDLRSLGNLRFACIGQATARRLLRYGFRADLVPEEYSSAALGKTLAERILRERAEKPVLLFRAEQGSQELTAALEAAGIPLEDRKIYRTVPVPPEGAGKTGASEKKRISHETGSAQEGIAETEVRYLVFGSAGCVRAWFAFSGIPEGTVPVCIGAYTAAELERQKGSLPPGSGWDGTFLTASEYSGEGIAAVIGENLRKKHCPPGDSL